MRGDLPRRILACGWVRELGKTLVTLAGVVGTTGAARVVLGRQDVANVMLVFLATIGVASISLGFRMGLLAAGAGSLAFDYYFLPPYHSVAITGFRNVMTFLGMFATAVFLSSVHEKLRREMVAARLSHGRVEALYALARELADSASVTEICCRSAAQIEKLIGGAACVLVREGGSFTRAYRRGGAVALATEDLGAAGWAASHLEPCGLGTCNCEGASAWYVPLVAGRGCIGVLRLRPEEGGGAAVAVEQSSLVGSMARQIALALDHEMLSLEKQSALLEAETERIRSAVLSSVSHDLRAPLAVIASASSTLVEHGDRLHGLARIEMGRIINDEAKRLNELLRSLLDVTRLQGGRIRISQEWESLEEIVGAALERIKERTAGRVLRANIPSDLPLLRMDAPLIEQAVFNLLDNALKHSLSEQPVEIDLAIRDGQVVVYVIDHGQGLAGGELTRIFDKFYRTERAASGGLGLGLTVARGIVEAHGGKIWATHTQGGGLTVQFTLPLDTSAPLLEVDDMLEAAVAGRGR